MHAQDKLQIHFFVKYEPNMSLICEILFISKFNYKCFKPNSLSSYCKIQNYYAVCRVEASAYHISRCQAVTEVV